MRNWNYCYGSLAALCMLVLTGCSGFHQAWKKELASTSSYTQNDLIGPWEGTWQSDANGHQGRLRCLITENPDGTYQAWYHAKYRRILSFNYEVEMRSTPGETGHAFTGQADLGMLAGGMYTYRGHTTNGLYSAEYDSKFDHGTFLMKRPPRTMESNNASSSKN